MNDILLLDVLRRELDGTIGGWHRAPTATLVWRTDREGFVRYRKPRKLEAKYHVSTQTPLRYQGLDLQVHGKGSVVADRPLLILGLQQGTEQRHLVWIVQIAPMMAGDRGPLSLCGVH